jgi:hypothetical protein
MCARQEVTMAQIRTLQAGRVSTARELLLAPEELIVPIRERWPIEGWDKATGA